jgi:hypothetical protein
VSDDEIKPEDVTPDAQPAELEAGPDGPGYYIEEGVRLYLVTQKGDQLIETNLTNFSARILADEKLDNGDELVQEDGRVYLVEMRRNGQRAEIPVEAERLGSFEAWMARGIEVGAIVHVGKGPHAANAIRIVSEGQAIVRTRFTSTGWRTNEKGDAFFVHRGGAIGNVDGEYVVALPGPADADVYTLKPVEDEAAAILASLGLVGLAPPEISAPLLLGIYRAAVPLPTRFSLYLYGQTGVFKTAIALVFLSHYGSKIGEPHLGSWGSTANAITHALYHHADVAFVIDDAAPDGDRSRRRAVQEQVFRFAGNQSGRDRLRSDITLRGALRPRALVISTGEDMPSFHSSILARILTLPLNAGNVNPGMLTAAQRDAHTGIYCGALHAWVEWIAANRDYVAETFERVLDEQRSVETDSEHRRSTDVRADMFATAEVLMRFAVDKGALEQSEAIGLQGLLQQAVARALVSHGRLSQGVDPIEVFREMLLLALVTGKAHVNDADGGPPPEAHRWGWKDGVGAGEHVGWIRGDRLFLYPDAAWALVAKLREAAGGSFPISSYMVGKTLGERGLLLTDGDPDHVRVKRRVQGTRPRVYDLPTTFVHESDDCDD